MKLHRTGIKPSIQRVAVMEYLIEHRIHPTVEQIFNGLCMNVPPLSKATIYNTLKLFVDKGLIQMLRIDERNVHYDADISEHAHFKCTECGSLFDIPIKHFNVEIVNSMKLLITGCHLYYFGRCGKCIDLEDHNIK
ncbi:MAG: transcriptional repressor [Prevotellaceae bacterium]|jgi:Fur family ferric uptake transcriptional regulator/Fur family peroxide stress response transcriptional regulator|nr:transcriptional repressor [Prevotellaceae bacterium]